MNKLEETVLVQEICRQLNASIEHLHPSIHHRLDNARQAALLKQPRLAQQNVDGLAQLVSRELDDNATVPAEIEARLDQIRHKAIARFEKLETRSKQSKGANLLGWFKFQFDSFNLAASAGMLASACVLITAISIFYVNSRPTGTFTLEEEIGLVASAEDIELYENLEFYLWLAENESLNL